MKGLKKYTGESPKMWMTIFCRSLAFLLVVVVIALFVLVATVLSIFVAQHLKLWFNGELSSWVQAMGTIIAVVSGFVVAFLQVYFQWKTKRKKERILVDTVHLLTFEAANLVHDRLSNAKINEKIWAKKEYAKIGEGAMTNEEDIAGLQGKKLRQKNRATEMIQAMRDFQISDVPTSMLKCFIQIRSQLFAINEGINEFYDSKPCGSLKSTKRVSKKNKEWLAKMNKVANEFGHNSKPIP